LNELQQGLKGCEGLQKLLAGRKRKPRNIGGVLLGATSDCDVRGKKTKNRPKCRRATEAATELTAGKSLVTVPRRSTPEGKILK